MRQSLKAYLSENGMEGALNQIPEELTGAILGWVEQLNLYEQAMSRLDLGESRPEGFFILSDGSYLIRLSDAAGAAGISLHYARDLVENDTWTGVKLSGLFVPVAFIEAPRRKRGRPRKQPTEVSKELE